MIGNGWNGALPDIQWYCRWAPDQRLVGDAAAPDSVNSTSA